MSAAAQEWVRNNPPSRVEAQANPVPKDNMQPEVSPEEREAIGLAAPVWTRDGRVLPAVRAALEQQEAVIRNDPDMAEFQLDRPIGFQGMAYIDVYLRHEPRGDHHSEANQSAVRAVQKRLLSDLTAAEFSQFFAFRTTAGLVGFATAAGIEKLARDPTVVAIGLDDQARPEDPPHIAQEPPVIVDGRVKRVGKVEAAVYETLERNAEGYVFVIVNVQKVNWAEVGVERGDALVKEMQERVLSALSAEEFRLRSRGGSFVGFANAAGLSKLDKHPDVWGVGVTRGGGSVEKVQKR